MRSLAASIVALLVVGLACEPQDRRPGLWLSGEPVRKPVADWSFSNEFKEIFVETRTRYGVPHSVTTVCAANGAKLYVPSLYSGGKGYPDGKYWTRNVARDPHVRLEIGGRLYERRAVLVSDPAERAEALAAFARKYPFWKKLLDKPEQPVMVLLRMDPHE